MNPYLAWGNANGRQELAGYVRTGARILLPAMARWLNANMTGYDSGNSNFFRAVGNNPVRWVDPTGMASSGPVGPNLSKTAFCLACDLEYATKLEGAALWADVMDNSPIWYSSVVTWFWELGPVTATFTRAGEPHNQDIQINSGFQKLLNCWIANNIFGAPVPPSKGGLWGAYPWGFSFHDGKFPWQNAGGWSGDDAFVNFVGSYKANITLLCLNRDLVTVHVHKDNQSDWYLANHFDKHAAFSPYDRGQWDCHKICQLPDVGGIMWEVYAFDVTTPVAYDCILP